MIYLFKSMKRIEEMTGERCYRFNNSESTLRIVFNTVMQNMDFNIGFNISRERLDRFINTRTEFVSVFLIRMHLSAVPPPEARTLR